MSPSIYRVLLLMLIVVSPACVRAGFGTANASGGDAADTIGHDGGSADKGTADGAAADEGAADSAPADSVPFDSHPDLGVDLVADTGGKKATGSLCVSSAECQSGNCVDGFCCNTTCGSACAACDVAGSEGTCTVLPDGSPGSPSCSPYLCNGFIATCPSTCASSSDCASGFSCSGTMCVP